MTNQQLFAKIWGQALKPEGYIEKNRCFFQYLPEKQLVKYIFMETLGNGKWCRISGDIQSFAGLVDPLDIRHQTLNSMDVMIPKLSGEPLDLIAYEFGKDAEQTLQNCLRTFFKYLFPKIKAVETVEDCYNYHLWSQKIVLNGIKGGMSLLFESYQTGH